MPESSAEMTRARWNSGLPGGLSVSLGTCTHTEVKIGAPKSAELRTTKPRDVHVHHAADAEWAARVLLVCVPSSSRPGTSLLGCEGKQLELLSLSIYLRFTPKLARALVYRDMNSSRSEPLSFVSRRGLRRTWQPSRAKLRLHFFGKKKSQKRKKTCLTATAPWSLPGLG